MDRIDSFNPERLKWCLADRGVTPEECASDLNISQDTLAGVLNGEVGPTPNQLRALAGYFGRGMLFFLERGPVDERKVRSTQFRTLANQKPKLSHRIKALIERVERQREVFLSLRDERDDAETPRFDAPDLRRLRPAAAAERARQWLGLGERNCFETLRTAIDARGVLVFRSNGYAGKWQIARESSIQGFSLYYADAPVIFVRKFASEARQTFTMAHELGHLLLHRASIIDDEADMVAVDGAEQEANAFAGNLLVPDHFLAQISDRDRPADVSQFEGWLAAPTRSWGASTEVVLRRLMDVGRLSRDTYAAYRRWCSTLAPHQESGGNREWRHREPRHLFGDRYVRLVLDALSAKEITLNKASSFLDNVKIEDLHQLERFYAGA